MTAGDPGTTLEIVSPVTKERPTMELHDVSYFFGGAFLANAVPHFVSGAMGRPFQSPFARPPGKGLSSATVNVLWGFANFVVAYFLIVRVGDFDLRATGNIVAAGLGVLLMGIMAAHAFGRFHGGNMPDGS
ncbi:MAG TPA: hypothetical protein VHU23_09150 [Rhizomicrobium sp.]|nr:hypothetical protein [Rhizomicrobium sp.]